MFADPDGVAAPGGQSTQGSPGGTGIPAPGTDLEENLPLHRQMRGRHEECRPEYAPSGAVQEAGWTLQRVNGRMAWFWQHYATGGPERTS